MLPLLKFYLANPAIAIRHSARAARLLASGEMTQVAALARSRLGLTNLETQQHRFEAEARRKLSALRRMSRRKPSVPLDQLLPIAADLKILDVVHDDRVRLKLATGHILTKYGLLDEDYYKSRYMNGVPGIMPLDHYMQIGVRNGFQPNAYFDPREYVCAYPDMVDSGIDPVVHYAFFGWKEGRTAGARFNAGRYVARHPELEDEDVPPFVHFLRNGASGGAEPQPDPSGQPGIRHANKENSRGTIIIVSHDAELGGAQLIVRNLARWFLAATGFDVKLVTMRAGPFMSAFTEIAPTFDISAFEDDQIRVKLDEFAGPGVVAVLVNSVASGGFLRHWDRDTPIIAYIHELTKLLEVYSDNLALIKDRAAKIIAGSEAVRTVLRDKFGVAAETLEAVPGFIEQFADQEPLTVSEKREAKISLGYDPDLPMIAACGVAHWRKSPEKFVDVAQKVIADASVPSLFVWVGGGPDKEHCETLVRDRGLEDHVIFTGYEPDIMPFLRASDVFLLPSMEDPFPLVCLYAATAGNPVICFEDAGGMPEFVGKGCGRAVAFGDTGAMADATLEYIRDKQARLADGETARRTVLRDHTVGTAGPALLHHIRRAAGLAPAATVIVPNYNYEIFLPQRLKSIADQTFQDFDVVLLDDNSGDNSLEVLEDWAARRPGTTVVANRKNSGSPFAQWIRGMRLATSELVWIAEADDYCELEFLANILPHFADRNVFLAHAKSVPVDENGTVLGDYEELYLDRIAKGRWSRSHVATDHEEANHGLGIANCIPNASSVVLRKFEPEPEFEKTVTGMKMCGDWLFYLRAMRGGLVAYNHRPLNYHRRHGSTVTSRTEGSRQYFDEFAEIRRHVSSTYHQKPETIARIKAFTRQDLNRFGIDDAGERAQIEAKIEAADDREQLPGLLAVVSDLSPGGGQMFGIRIANAWARRGGRVVLVNARHFPDHPKVVSKIDSRVALIHVDDQFPGLPEIVERYGLDVVHSSIWWADKFVYRNIGGLPDLPWVVTMHGCYETILDNKAVDLEFGEVVKGMLSRVSCWVPTAKKNRRVFEKFGDPALEKLILNGVDVEPGKKLSRRELGLREDALVLILATRAIAEKGWFEAVEAVQLLNAAKIKTDLMLIGEGPAAEAIERKAPPNVHLYGHVDDLQDYIETADIGLLPSKFVGESMPLVILEMMARGKPVVATDVGEIPQMLTGSNRDVAGQIVRLNGDGISASDLSDAIKELSVMSNRSKAAKLAKKIYKNKFTTGLMMDGYEEIYRSMLDKRYPKIDHDLVQDGS